MQTILVWLLISTSSSYSNTGSVRVLAKFKDLDQCEHVLKNIPQWRTTNRCVQAEIIKE